MMMYTMILMQLEQALREVDVSEIPAFVGALERVKTMALGRMMTGYGDSPLPPPVETGRYLTVQEVCTRYRVTARWLYRHKKQLPHSQPSRKVLLFPEAALTRWFERRT